MVAETVIQVTEHIIYHIDSTVGDLTVCSDADVNRIYSWNRGLENQSYPERGIHEAISSRCIEAPASIAVSAWDGELTYAELDRLSSGLANRLRDLGVCPEKFVPLCFDKSKWAVVALLGVLKSGGAYIFLDCSLPMRRIRSMCLNLLPEVVLCSLRNERFAMRLTERVITLGDDCRKSFEPAFKAGEKPASTSSGTGPSNAMYAVFTSGSTGQPKGVVTEHTAFYSMAIANGKALGVTPQTRMLQFASYSFDVSNRDMLITLLFGGCICIPSEDDRINDLTGFINRHNVNTASLTPSLTNLLFPASLPTLQTLILGGEPMTETHISMWAKHVRLFNAYGVSESTGIAALLPDIRPGFSPRNIGFGCGSRLWIVDAERPDKLVPIGAVGELLIDGPSLARHYIGDKERTYNGFLAKTEWQTRFYDQNNKQNDQARLYRTGDMVRYNMDGSLHYIGRRDSQVKLNGQRVELTEIEHHMRTCPEVMNLEICHVAVTASGNKTNKFTPLFAFLDLGPSHGPGVTQNTTMSTWEPAESVKAAIKEHLLLVLPAYMIPTHFFFVRNISLTASGKIDRLELRNLATELLHASQDKDVGTDDLNPSSTTFAPKELVLRKLWADVLGIAVPSFQRNDCFFQRGGDSIAVMRLAAKLRERGFIMKVADAIKCSTLGAMSSILVKDMRPSQPVDLAPFSLIHDAEITINSVKEKLGPSSPQIEDIYPCTPMQRGLMALAARDLDAYIGRYVWKLPRKLQIDRFKRAWELTWLRNPILRTRILQIPQGMFQVVLAENIPWHVTTDTSDCGSDGNLTKINVDDGQLAQFHLGHGCFRLEIHHSLFDEWSLDLILGQVERAYAGENLHVRHFNQFVRFLMEQPETDLEHFWAKEYAGLQTEHFPAASNSMKANHAAQRTVLEEVLELDGSFSTKYTLSTILRLAWAMVLWRQTLCKDVVFGATVSGRNAEIDGIDQLSGPTLTTVPLRIRLSMDQTIDELLLQVQNQFAEMMNYEQTGLLRIRKVGPEAAEGCNFQNLLVVQPRRQKAASSIFDDITSMPTVSDNINSFVSYPLTLICRPGNKSISFTSSFDSSILPPDDMRSILRQMSHITKQLMVSQSTLVADFSVIPQDDITRLEKWNHHVPASLQTCIHDLIQQMCFSQPHRTAVCSNHEELTYAQLEKLSNGLASHLMSKGIQRGHFVPLLFEKSPWTTVGIMAVLKAGAAFALLDPSHPVHRLKLMCSTMDAKIVVSSKKNARISENLLLQVIILDPASLIQNLGNSSVKAESLSTSVTPEDPAYAVFTSGSTGHPKGIVVPHSAISTNVEFMRQYGMVTPESRVFQFAGYAFDVSVGDHLFTLAAGACICVPSEEDRLDNPAKAAADLRANWAHLTPSVITLMDPSDIPTLKVLVSGGEPLNSTVVRRWTDKVNFVSFYGPAECSVISHVVSVSSSSECSNIGRSPVAMSWVVDPEDHNRLVPIGTVGELLIEGPTVTSGYLKDPEKTAAAFIASPPWRAEFPAHPGKMYKTGDLVQYAPDGTLHFIGRKDFQVKLNGRRLETGEIEQCITSSFPNIDKAAVELIKFPEQNNRSLLIAFICPKSSETWGNSETTDIEVNANGLKVIDPLTNQFYRDLDSLTLCLREYLPAYMIPSRFIPTAEMPLNMSGKTNRRLLREQISTWSATRLASYQSQAKSQTAKPQRPVTEHDRKIQHIICQVLNIKPDELSMDRKFFALGGDSISAMQVSILARHEGIRLSVADIFTHQTLSTLALKSSKDSTGNEHVQVEGPKQVFCREGSGLVHNSLCHEWSYDKLRSRLPVHIAENMVEAIPTTEFQAMTLSQFYNRYLIISLPSEVDRSRLLEACRQTVRKHSALRTVFGINDDSSVVQVILRELEIDFIQLSMIEDLEEHCANDSLAMEIPTNWKPTFQIWLATLTDSRAFMALRLLHAQFDGVSIGVICEDLISAYNKTPLQPASQFSAHVRGLWAMHTLEAYDIWKSVLQNSQMTSLAGLEERDQESKSNKMPDSAWVVTVSTKIALPSPPSNITMATLVKSAWAVTLMRLFCPIQGINENQEVLKHVVFGQVVHGRGLGISHEDRIVGPCLNIIPVRVNFPRSLTNLDLMRQVQGQHIETMPAQNLGMKDIARNCTSWEPGTKLGSFVRFQNYGKNKAGNVLLHGNPCEASTYSLPNRPSETANVLVIPDESTLRITMTISSEIMGQKTADRVVGSFGETIEHLASESSFSVRIGGDA